MAQILLQSQAITGPFIVTFLPLYIETYVAKILILSKVLYTVTDIALTTVDASGKDTGYYFLYTVACITKLPLLSPLYGDLYSTPYGGLIR